MTAKLNSLLFKINMIENQLLANLLYIVPVDSLK